MALDYSETLDRLVAKVTVLAQKYAALANSRQQALDAIKALQEDVAKKDALIQKLKVEAEYLRTAAVLAPSREQVEATRATISALVRDIDRCIADLEE